MIEKTASGVPISFVNALPIPVPVITDAPDSELDRWEDEQWERDWGHS